MSAILLWLTTSKVGRIVGLVLIALSMGLLLKTWWGRQWLRQRELEVQARGAQQAQERERRDEELETLPADDLLDRADGWVRGGDRGD